MNTTAHFAIPNGHMTWRNRATVGMIAHAMSVSGRGEMSMTDRWDIEKHNARLGLYEDAVDEEDDGTMEDFAAGLPLYEGSKLSGNEDNYASLT